MKRAKVHCLTIAGHDPCDGAGLTSDVKTFQSCGVESLSVCTAITFQNDDAFEGINWLSAKTIVRQLEMLLATYSIKSIKIGLVESLETLQMLLVTIHSHYTVEDRPYIVWDPILSASAGFQFHGNLAASDLERVLSSVDLVTPNIPEAAVLFPNIDWSAVDNLPCSVLLKGGHGNGNESKDVLYVDGKEIPYSAKRLDVKKHGTGCVLSAALCAYVAQGKELPFAVQYAKDYLHKELLALASVKK